MELPEHLNKIELNHQSEILQSVIEELKRKNVRITSPRRAILEFLIKSQAHPTADEIYKALLSEIPGMSLATVYNNLNQLVDFGLVHELKLSGGSSRYDFMGHQHIHIYCVNCGKIVDYPKANLDEIKKRVQRDTGFKIHQDNLEMYGLCPDCQNGTMN